MVKTHTRQGKQPTPGSRFPSQILGDNIRDIRLLRKLSQKDMLERLETLGQPMSQATLSEVERALRPTSVDELFAFALALETTVVKLLDPAGVAGEELTGIDLGIPDESGAAVCSRDARLVLVSQWKVKGPWSLRPNFSVEWEGNTYRGLGWQGNVGEQWATPSGGGGD